MGMSRSKATAIDVVETAYRSAGTAPDRWLDDVFSVLGPMLARGGEVFAYEYDTTRSPTEWLSRPIFLGAKPTAVDAVMASFVAAPQSLKERIHKHAGAVTILSELIGTPAGRHDALGPHASVLGMADMLGLNASDPSGRGTYFCATTPRRRFERAREDVQRWEQIAAHIAAASRLRRALLSPPEAVLSPTGQILHSGRRAEGSLAALTRQARIIDSARTPSRRREPEALRSWRALVEGRWSLVDVVESDGRRVLFAVANAASAPDPRRLTPIERTIAGYVAMGHSNKLVAYELGISVGAVSAHTRTIFKKFGFRTRVELVNLVTLLSSGSVAALDHESDLVAVSAGDATLSGASRLTAAEREVATMAARGRSNADIAAARGVSRRTIQNQLLSIFTKLRIESRTELALLLR
jgi:DNA-binding CsgD family transcriptional regulator